MSFLISRGIYHRLCPGNHVLVQRLDQDDVSYLCANRSVHWTGYTLAPGPTPIYYFYTGIIAGCDTVETDSLVIRQNYTGAIGSNPRCIFSWDNQIDCLMRIRKFAVFPSRSNLGSSIKSYGLPYVI